MGEVRDKIEGEIKDAGGKLTGDKRMEWEGKAQKGKGKLEEMANELHKRAAEPPEPAEPTAP